MQNHFKILHLCLSRVWRMSWFVNWFDTPYYHDLYRHRDDREAMLFVTRLRDYFGWTDTSSVLDVCCGNGRHALSLERMGVSAWGVDLSPSNINHAKGASQFPQRWRVSDVRILNMPTQFDGVVNLFTSFGYFDSDEDHALMLSNIAKQLKPHGRFVLDFLNVSWVKNHLVANEVKSGTLTDYHIIRKMDDRWIEKEIAFDVNGVRHTHAEKVRAFAPAQIEEMLNKAGFEVLNHFGDYSLQAFNTDSPRCIFVCKLSEI